MRWQCFFRSIQQDLKVVMFFWLMFFLLRVAFIAAYHVELGADWRWTELGFALYCGFRISLKSAGVIGLLSLLFCSLPLAVWKRGGDRLRSTLAAVYAALLALLFEIRLVYFNEFHQVFNQFMFNGLYDDKQAIADTVFQRYQVGWRLLTAAVISFAAVWLLKKWLRTPTLIWPAWNGPRNWLAKIAVGVVIIAFMIFNRFGGAFSYAHSIHWENSGMSRINLLNEAILDDVQALYRAHNTYVRLQEGMERKMDPLQLQQQAMLLAGRPGPFATTKEVFARTAQGPRLAKPKHIYILLEESYAAWALEEKYRSLHLTDGMQKLIAQPDTQHVAAFLPNADGSIQAVCGLVTGLAEVNLHPNYKPSAYQQPYETALAPQMKRLGYRTYFWYGGFSSWERVKEFSLAQGFDEFYGAADLKAAAGNAWGVNDREFFTDILRGSQTEEPSLHLIFTTSNHPPYTVDLQAEGLNEEQLKAAMPEAQRGDVERVTQNGHFWYADKAMSEFIEKVRQQDQASLFIIIGDHSTRFLAEPTATLWERTAVPFVISGSGVTKDLLPADAAGSHISIIPTLIELLAPNGFAYYSAVEPLTRSRVGIGRDNWVTAHDIGANQGEETSDEAISRLRKQAAALQALSWWRIANGEQLP